MELDKKQIDCNRREIVKLLISTRREGIVNVIDYLYTSGFFSAPSSINRHHNWKGGLAQHSLGVYKKLKYFKLPDKVSKESLILCALLHDICKASILHYDANGNIMKRAIHIKGHGYRSIKLLEMLGLKLNKEECMSIRWHMGFHHVAEVDMPQVEDAKTSELCWLIRKADQLDASKP